MVGKKTFAVAAAIAMLVGVSATASAHPDGSGAADDGSSREPTPGQLQGPWVDGGHDDAHDEPTNDPSLPDTLGSTGSKTLDVVGRGQRNVVGATTDVWAHDGYAYTGTFNAPCGGDPEAGVWVWDVHNRNKVRFVTVIESPVGSRVNDVRVATMNSGDILVHSNEPCDGGPGGFEIYDVNDPRAPQLLASVQTDDVNAFLRDNFDFVDAGVHNLFLFTQGHKDYVAATVESEFGNFQIFDITDPANPTRVGFWGAEQLGFPGVADWETLSDFGVILAADAYLFDGFGSSRNRFLHDVTISADGTTAYLANWDAGLVMLDISDPSDPELVSVAIDPTSGDGEVNSHSVWPNEDGSIVIEGEEDFSAWEGVVPPSNVTFGNANPIPGIITSTTVGDAFEANQTGNSGTIYADHIVVESGPLVGTYAANEFSGNNFPLGEGSVSGNMVFAGRACAGDALLNEAALENSIAIVRRGACTFAQKSQSVSAAGAVAIVVVNQAPSSWWSGFRVWDYSDPSNPRLASTIDTPCSLSLAPSSSCVADGTYSSHNVIVETTDDGRVLAYIAWYNDGMIVYDISDPDTPVQVARYLGTNEEGVLNDFWGVYKIPDEPWIYASDRNGGLYVFQLRGKGLQKKGG